MAIVEFRLPDVGEGLAEAEVIEWHVAPGDTVRVDQLLLVVQTDKSLVDIPSPVAGSVKELGALAGEIVSVGDILIVLESDSPPESVTSESPTPRRSGTPEDRGQGPDSDRRNGDLPAAIGRGPRASPTVRKLAYDAGVDMTSLRGTGPAGRITRQDVLEAAGRSAPPTASAPEILEAAATAGPVPLRGLRRQIAHAVTASASVPAIDDWRDVDAGALVESLAALRAGSESAQALTYMALFVRAAAVALRAHRTFNATFDSQKEELTVHPNIDIGIATATPDGLIVPVLRNADVLSLTQLARALDKLTSRARSRRIAASELHGGTFTITNFGSYGAVHGRPLIRVPEVAILGIGRLHDAVVPVAGVPAVRPILPVVVVCDHRVIDGHELGAFATTLIAALEAPVALLQGEV